MHLDLLTAIKRITWLLIMLPSCKLSAEESLQDKSESKYDLMFIIDATYSMGNYVKNLKKVLPQIVDLVTLTGFVDRLSVFAYRDYSCDRMTEWSGWKKINQGSSLESFVGGLVPDGGSEIPEALKTGLYEAGSYVDPSKKTICIMYLDAPPHHQYKGEKRYPDIISEDLFLGDLKRKWLNVCEFVQKRGMIVYPLFDHMVCFGQPFLYALAKETGGKCIKIEMEHLIQTTIGILLDLGGIEFTHASTTVCLKMPSEVDLEALFEDNSLKYKHSLINDTLKIEAVEELKIDRLRLQKLFYTSDEYRQTVFDVLKRIITPEGILSFTYNAFFAHFWHFVINAYKDEATLLNIPVNERESKQNEYREEIKTLLNKYSSLIGSKKLDEDTKKHVKAFNDSGYDDIEEVMNIIRSYPDEGPYYILDCDKYLERKEVTNIGTSCKSGEIQIIVKMLMRLRISDERPSDDSNRTYLPINMKIYHIFKLLPHLMRPGMLFKTRNASIIAAIAINHESMLKTEAIKYLESNKGRKWIDLGLPENNSLNFANLILPVAIHALTDEERVYFETNQKLYRLKHIESLKINVMVSYTSENTLRYDPKQLECPKCKQKRSFTLILDDTCAICESRLPTEDIRPERYGNSSYMCECSECLVHYAVYNHQDLLGVPKCHFCRYTKKPAPYIECMKCENKFLYQKTKREGEFEEFTCYICQKGSENVLSQKITIQVRDYLKYNGAGFIGYNLNDYPKFFNRDFKLSSLSYEQKKSIIIDTKEGKDDDIGVHAIVLGKNKVSSKRVLNSEEIEQIILTKIQSIKGEAKEKHCMICFDNFPIHELRTICGKNGSKCDMACRAMACKACLTKYYNTPKRGGVVHMTQLLCPFCKRQPSLTIVQKYSKDLRKLMVENKDFVFDASNIYAWCNTCNKIKAKTSYQCGFGIETTNNEEESNEEDDIESDRRVGVESGEDNTNFTCTECLDEITSIKGVIIKRCPSCSAPTIKYTGCNHMQCVNALHMIALNKWELCGVHWCWVCGKESTSRDIVKHLNNVHGGIYTLEDIIHR